MNIYIAGKINGLKNYREVFKKAEDYLTSKGHTCMNPSVLSEGFDYEVYLPICLQMLQACDAIYMLDNWKDSKGAKVELEYAKVQGKEIIYETDEDAPDDVRFYEFDRFEYYALIIARDMEKAKKGYVDIVSGIDEEDQKLSPGVLTLSEAVLNYHDMGGNVSPMRDIFQGCIQDFINSDMEYMVIFEQVDLS